MKRSRSPICEKSSYRAFPSTSTQSLDCNEPLVVESRSIEKSTLEHAGNQLTSTTKDLYHPFEASYNDHFETSDAAFLDLYPVLHELRLRLRPSSPQQFSIYDPYYCCGRMRIAWNNIVPMSDICGADGATVRKNKFPSNQQIPQLLPVTKIFHENRDFYADIASGSFPFNSTSEDDNNSSPDSPKAESGAAVTYSYDFCVTNPPYSEDHIERFLRKFAIPSKKPWGMLVPEYVATKAWYKLLIEEFFDKNRVFYVPPGDLAGIGKSRTVVKKDEDSSFPLRKSKPIHIPKIPLPNHTGGSDSSIFLGSDVQNFTGNDVSHIQKPASEKMTEPFYLIPSIRYEFDHPVIAGRSNSHFKSMWVIWLGNPASPSKQHLELLQAVKCQYEVTRRALHECRRQCLPHRSKEGHCDIGGGDSQYKVRIISCLDELLRRSTTNCKSNNGGIHDGRQVRSGHSTGSFQGQSHSVRVRGGRRM